MIVTYYMPNDEPIIEHWPDDTPLWQVGIRARYHGCLMYEAQEDSHAERTYDLGGDAGVVRGGGMVGRPAAG